MSVRLVNLHWHFSKKATMLAGLISPFTANKSSEGAWKCVRNCSIPPTSVSHTRSLVSLFRIVSTGAVGPLIGVQLIVHSCRFVRGRMDERISATGIRSFEGVIKGVRYVVIRSEKESRYLRMYGHVVSQCSRGADPNLFREGRHF